MHHGSTDSIHATQMNSSPAKPQQPRSKQIRIGLAGLGKFGCNHAEILAHCPEAELAAVCDTDTTALEKQLERHPQSRGYQSFNDLIADPQLDAIVIATPEHLHHEHALAAIRAGHSVFLEKPMASSLQDAEELRQASQAASVILQIGFVLRYEASHVKLKQEIDTGSFGEIISIRAKRNCSRQWARFHLDYGHTIYETLIHDLDLMLWLTNSQPERVMAMERKPKTYQYSEALSALIHFKNGSLGVVESSWFVPEGSPLNVTTETWQGTIDAELEVVGSQRTAKLRLLDAPLQIWSEQASQSIDVGLWPLLHGSIGGALRDELYDFVRCVREQRTSTIANLDDAVEGLRMAEAIQSAAASGSVLKLPNQ
jgi:predicted dehydrogenase